MFTVRTPLPLEAAGLLHILPPARFTVIVHVRQAVSVVAICVLRSVVTETMTASTMVNVTGTTATAGTGHGIGTGTGTGTGTGGTMTSLGTTPALGTAPVGSANTGGGGSLQHASIVPELAAGIAALLAGAGLAITGVRRRRRHTSA